LRTQGIKEDGKIRTGVSGGVKNMNYKEWENCNTCWTCKHRKILAGRIHCGHTIHDGTYKALWNVDIINSPYCPHREKEDWRDCYDKA